MNWAIRHLLVVLCTMVQTAPATAPTTASTTVAIDLSSPRAVAKSLRLAVERGDVGAVTACIFVADEAHRPICDAYARLIVATNNLADAIAARFGSSGDALAVGTIGARELKSVDTARVTTRPDGSAIMQLRGIQRGLPLRRGDDGSWRVDLLAYANADKPDDAEHAPQQVALLSELAESIDELATDTRTGRFNSIADVKAAVQDRVHSAVARSLRRDRPASRPASQPASQPTTAPSTAPS